jgi:aryl sulfotransferase
MASVLRPTRRRIHVLDDSRRWDGFVSRRDDIFITTPAKSGTTWTQGIVSSLLWPNGDAPAPAFDLAPWLDSRGGPVDDTHAWLDALAYRRIIKTHSPADCTPIFTECRYLAVYRDGRDALVSWANHRRKMRPQVMEVLNAAAAVDGIAPWPPVWGGDMDQLFDEWVDWGTPMEHLASWWPLRGEPFVFLVHYADLLADLDGEMRRIADFLDVDVPAELWDDAVKRCEFEAMKSGHESSAKLPKSFDGGATSFFNQGTNGRWSGVLTEAQLQRHDDLVHQLLPDDAALWLERGSLALGRRP